MFSPKEDVIFWARLTRLTRGVMATKPSINASIVAKSNYAAMLTAAFTVLFNTRLKQRGGCL